MRPTVNRWAEEDGRDDTTTRAKATERTRMEHWETADQAIDRISPPLRHLEKNPQHWQHTTLTDTPTMQVTAAVTGSRLPPPPKKKNQTASYKCEG